VHVARWPKVTGVQSPWTIKGNRGTAGWSQPEPVYVICVPEAGLLLLALVVHVLVVHSDSFISGCCCRVHLKIWPVYPGKK